jgi:hypothetical protein
MTGAGPRASEAGEAQLGRVGRIQPMANKKWKKAFLIFKSFLNSELI